MSKHKNSGSISLSKHRKAFGKTNRNPTNNMRLIRELEQEEAARKALIEKRKGKFYSSVKELMDNQ